MQIEPNGLLAGDPLHPLVSGHPFIHGNVLQGNGIDGMAVVTSWSYFFNATASWQYIGAGGGQCRPSGDSNQTVNTVWDLTDITYVLRGTVVLAGSYYFITGGPHAAGAQPDGRTRRPPARSVSLTIQAALPGTVLADGETIPNPGCRSSSRCSARTRTTGQARWRSYGSTGLGASQ